MDEALLCHSKLLEGSGMKKIVCAACTNTPHVLPSLTLSMSHN